MSEIPADIMETAEKVLDEAIRADIDDESKIIAHAILAERQRTSDLIESQAAKIADLEKLVSEKTAILDRLDGMDGGACSYIREKLDAFGAPRAAFIDDHIGNGILHARQLALEEAANVAESFKSDTGEYAEKRAIAAAIRSLKQGERG